MKALLIYPHQLFKNHPGIAQDVKVFLIEEPLFFTEFPMHRQKLMLHRLSMQAYQSSLEEKGYDVRYISCQDLKKTEDIFGTLKKEKITECEVMDVTDFWLHKRLEKASQDNNIPITWIKTMLFILEKDDAKKRYINSKKLMKNFYRNIRVDLNLLMDGDEPLGGKWSFDEDNRKKLPKKIKVPAEMSTLVSDEVAEAREWVGGFDGELYGDTEKYWIPYNHTDAEGYLEKFLTERFCNFGTYEDALSQEHVRVFHSTISPLLNIGLLEPVDVIKRAIEYTEKNNVPINSLEGFVRQIVGWREFMRAAYEVDGSMMRTKNFWGYTKKLPKAFWRGETGIDPVDLSIKRSLEYGYVHHIERLMVIGNCMLLAEYSPDEVYRWFMALYVDSYDWVMVPNVYGMSQFADGGIFATKPYIAGSNYLKKMSDYPKGPWEEKLTGLYWNFIHTHKEFFLKNHRLSMMPRLLEKMSDNKRQTHLENAILFNDSVSD